MNNIPFRARLRWLLPVGGCVLAAALIGIPAVALARSSPVTYYACVTTKTGTLKIVSKSATCASRQHKISWNNIGQAGPRESRGPPARGGHKDRRAPQARKDRRARATRMPSRARPTSALPRVQPSPRSCQRTCPRAAT
jgi:hypothetical protein